MDFDAVAVDFTSEASDQIIGVVDEKYGVFDGVFLRKLGEKLSSDRDRIGWKQPCMEDSVCFGIDRSIQPVVFAVDPDHFLIESNAIRALTVSWLQINFLYPIVNSNTTSIDTQIIKENNCIQK
jgi:hypothetical protein